MLTMILALKLKNKKENNKETSGRNNQSRKKKEKTHKQKYCQDVKTCLARKEKNMLYVEHRHGA